MTDPYRLYYAPDNASLIIRLALEEMRLSYKCILVDRATRAQNSPDYLALNPTGKIPTLITPDGPLSETAAILLWLSERHKKLAPAIENPERAEFLKWFFFTANTLHPDLIFSFYTSRYVPDTAIIPAQGMAFDRINTHLQQLDAAAATTIGLADSDPSILDCYLAACLRWLALYPQERSDWFDLTRFPNLCDMAERFEQRPSTQHIARAEGLGPSPFTRPVYANPPEGSAL